MSPEEPPADAAQHARVGSLGSPDGWRGAGQRTKHARDRIQTERQTDRQMSVCLSTVCRIRAVSKLVCEDRCAQRRHSAGRTATVQSRERPPLPDRYYALLMRRLLARCCAIMCAMVSASTCRGITRSKSAAIVSSVGASPERGASGAACGASRSKAWSWVRLG